MQLPFFYSAELLNVGEGILSEETSRHVSQVLRMEAGEHLQLTNGKGVLQTAEILQAHKKHTSVKILASETGIEKLPKIILGIAPVKNLSRFEWFLEKVTEIGITKIIPIKCARSERMQLRYERLQNILISAMLQSRQRWLPELVELQEISEVVKSCDAKNKFIAHCLFSEEKTSLFNEIRNLNGDRIVLIGPEGDFTESEIDLAINNNFKAVTLGSNRLRTETAGIAACIMLNAS